MMGVRVENGVIGRLCAVLSVLAAMKKEVRPNLSGQTFKQSQWDTGHVQALMPPQVLLRPKLVS